jgi:putative addiction module killer protein
VRRVFLRTPEFDAWLTALRDQVGKARVLARIRSAEAGNFGDLAAVGRGVFEMRVHVGPGCRVYYCRRGRVTYLLLCGGDKSTQRSDIRAARDLLTRLKGRS